MTNLLDKRVRARDEYGVVSFEGLVYKEVEETEFVAIELDNGEWIYWPEHFCEAIEFAEEASEGRVIKIDPAGKYIIFAPKELTMADVAYLKDEIQRWWESDRQFLILWGGLTLERVEK